MKRKIIVCSGSACIDPGGKRLEPELRRILGDKNAFDLVEIEEAVCYGHCGSCPMIVVEPEGTFYGELNSEKLARIIDEHIIGGQPVEALLATQPMDTSRIRMLGSADFFGKQLRITLRNCGIIDPESFDDYLQMRGYEALAKVLEQMTPEQVISEVEKSGMRGRGGGGYPTGLKWRQSTGHDEEKSFVICNADEGDPGAFMDRSAIEGDPFCILEGMTIGGYAIGATQGYVYVRAEYPLAIKRLRYAIDEARKRGLLGKSIFGTNFNFDIDIRLGAGAFVCGEETALIASIEGRRGMPRPRPPYPAQSGLWGYPTLINNVETWANVPAIFLNGADWFAGIGTEKSKGTKVFALAGKIKNTGLVEVPMGTTLREIIYDIGGGIKNDKKFKAVQTGGPSGGCIPEQFLDTPVDYESLMKAGSIMGSGGMIVMDEDTCMVDVAKFFLTFTQDESCGKCTPCREGTKRLLEILTRITEGKGVPEDLQKLEHLGKTVKRASLCGLGQSAPNPILSTLQNFREEYEAHINEKRCPAGVCSALLNYYVDPDKCVGCTLCAKVCPVKCISGEPKKTHVIDTSICIKCGECKKKCPVKAIYRK
ncbi:MAG: NADH-ubiquinone oxidoreductase-F iron-sulfur binding region domain-containing protein [Armatimonadota bacterium]|nr:4Fe-4S binding protein [bacterium]